MNSPERYEASLANSSALSGISFDYGHVLGGFDVAELCSRLGELGADVGASANEAVHAALPRAYGAHDEVVGAAGHEAGWRALVGCLVKAAVEAATPTALAELVDALWLAQPTRNLWRHVPAEARQLLDSLSARGIPMVITSNSEGRVFELLQEVGIAHHFRAVLDSGRLPFGKPDPRIFAMACAALEARADQVVHIGDSEAADIEGALGAGLRAIRFDGFVPNASQRPSRAPKVTTHAELLAMLLPQMLPQRAR